MVACPLEGVVRIPRLPLYAIERLSSNTISFSKAILGRQELDSCKTLRFPQAAENLYNFSGNLQNILWPQHNLPKLSWLAASSAKPVAACICRSSIALSLATHTANGAPHDHLGLHPSLSSLQVTHRMWRAKAIALRAQSTKAARSTSRKGLGIWLEALNRRSRSPSICNTRKLE